MQTRAHTAVLAGACLQAVAAVILLILAARVADPVGDGGAGRWLAAAGAVALAVVAVVRLGLRVWEWDRTVLAVTDEQVLVVTSALSRRSHVVPLVSVRDLRVRQGLGGRLLGYGTIVLDNSGHRSSLAYVPRPAAVSALIAVRAGRGGDGAPR